MLTVGWASGKKLGRALWRSEAAILCRRSAPCSSAVGTCERCTLGNERGPSGSQFELERDFKAEERVWKEHVLGSNGEGEEEEEEDKKMRKRKKKLKKWVAMVQLFAEKNEE